jgi:adenylate kinase
MSPAPSGSVTPARGQRVNLLVLGPQGSGKGTQAQRISTEYGIPHVATGDMFRAAIAEASEVGRQVQEILAAGELVPDDLTVALIRDRLARDDASTGFVLDGFPRNLSQADALDAMLGEEGRSLDAILFFRLGDDIATQRMLGRASHEGRPDDAPEAIRRRLELYHEQTEPVVERYRTTGKLVPLHAERAIDAVFAEIQEALRLVDGRSGQ